VAATSVILCEARTTFSLQNITTFMAKMICVLLVGGFNPSEEYEFVSWDDYAQYMEK
jgi:hypothetical protein